MEIKRNLKIGNQKAKMLQILTSKVTHERYLYRGKKKKKKTYI